MANDAMEVLGQVFELGSTYSDATAMISLSGAITSVISVVGAVLGLIGKFVPDRKHEQILQGLEELSDKIDLVRGDIHQLEKDIKWGLTVAAYADSVNDIMLGIEYVQKIGKASGNATKMLYLNKLRDHCSGERCSIALTFILNGMNGKGQRPILDTFYEKTGGSRPYISALGTRLLQLVCGGMIAVSTYDTVRYGKEGAKAFIQSFNRQLNEARSKFQSTLSQCMNNFKENMLKDLNKELDEGGSNLVAEISDFMRDKYDWLENFVLVYNNLYGPEKHCFKGNQVSSLRRRGKCGIVFYRTKGEPSKFSHRINEAQQIVNNGKCGRNRADRCLNEITTGANGRGIGWIGCAVIQSNSNLKFGGTFSYRVATAIGGRFSKFLLLQ